MPPPRTTLIDGPKETLPAICLVESSAPADAADATAGLAKGGVAAVAVAEEATAGLAKVRCILIETLSIISI